MARLILVLDVTAEPNLWDPHEVIEDILANADKLPTFEPGMSWFINEDDTDSESMHIQEGTFVSCEWADEPV